MKIAIFENNQSFRESLEFAIVTSNDMELCGSFEDTSRLLQKIEALRPDVVLIDINIPGKNSIEAVKEIKEIFPDVNVCMQTVFEDEDKIFASLCNGASGYILKHVSTEKLLQAIREVADGGSFFTPIMAKKISKIFQGQPQKLDYIPLTEKEKEVLKYLAEGLSDNLIADKVNLSFHNIHTHVKNIYKKLQVNSKGEVMAKALKNKLP